MSFVTLRRAASCGLAAIAAFARQRWLPQAQEVKERTLKFAFSLAKDHPMGVGAQNFADLVAQKSGGKLKITPVSGRRRSAATPRTCRRCAAAPSTSRRWRLAFCRG